MAKCAPNDGRGTSNECAFHEMGPKRGRESGKGTNFSYICEIEL